MKWFILLVLPICILFVIMFFFGIGLYWGYTHSNNINCTISNVCNITQNSIIQRDLVQNKTFYRPLFICDVTELHDNSSPTVYIGYYDCFRPVNDIKEACINDYMIWSDQFCYTEKTLIGVIPPVAGGNKVTVTPAFIEPEK